jgi:UDP-GlcNAc:undecaprenyl-phosphate GlcNAc-1-phosphate transferase
MGDVGSTFLGFAFAALAVLASQEAQQTDRLPLLLSMPLLLLHYLFDTVYTFCRRLRAGENVFTAHRSHLYQLLNRSGLSHRQVTLIYAGMACLQGLAATWMSTAPSAEFTSRLWLFAPLLAGHGVFTFWVIRRSRRLKLI